MSFRVVFLQEFGKAFIPKKRRPTIRKYFLKAGIKQAPYKLFGGMFYVSLLLTGFLYIYYVYPYLVNLSPFFLAILSFMSWIIIQVLIVVVISLIINFYLDIRIYKRTKELESMFADYLQSVSSNLKGGMSFENSLWAAIKPKFKILASEMTQVSKKVMTGFDIQNALIELSDKYDSLMLKRSMDLIISELESGGNIADLIDRIVENIKKTRALREEMAAAALGYIIFISVIVIVIAPLLFSLSYSLLIIISNFMGKMVSATQNVQGLPFQFSAVTVDIGHFKIFSYSALIVISLFSSMIVSIVEKGDIKGGLKYLPIFIVGTLLLYIVFMQIMNLLFSGLFTI